MYHLLDTASMHNVVLCQPGSYLSEHKEGILKDFCLSDSGKKNPGISVEIIQQGNFPHQFRTKDNGVFPILNEKKIRKR